MSSNTPDKNSDQQGSQTPPVHKLKTGKIPLMLGEVYHKISRKISSKEHAIRDRWKLITRAKKFAAQDLVPGDHGFRWQRILRFILLAYHHLKSRNVNQSASALSFDLILAIIPTFFLGFSLLNVFGNDGAIQDYLKKDFIPLPEEQLKGLFDILDKQNYGTIGSIGIVTLLIFSTNLFLKVENVFNQIWKVPDRRPFIRRFTNYFTFLMLAPILFSISVHFSSEFKIILSGYTFTSTLIALLSYLLSGIFVMAMFLLIFISMPNTRVRLRSALIGALVSAILFLILRSIFGFYVTTFALKSYSNIFGTISIVPLFFVWIYLTWIIVLIGAAIAYVFQRYKFLWKNSKEEIINNRSTGVALVTTEKMIEIFYIIAENFKSGKGSTTFGEITHYFSIPTDSIAYITDKWVENELLIRYEENFLSFIPKRPLDQIELFDIVKPFFEEVEIDGASLSLRQFIGTYRSMRSTFIDEKNITDLL